MVDGIEIDKKVAEESLIPEDLNSLAVGSYVVPDPRKRLQYPYFVFAVLIITFVTSQVIDYVSFIPTFIILTFIIAILFTVDNKFKIQQQEVIERITDKIDHSIGYYSIALTFLFSLKNILTPLSDSFFKSTFFSSNVFISVTGTPLIFSRVNVLLDEYSR